MTKITKIEDKTYQGKVTGHTITLSDGVTGYLDDKNSDSVREGDDVTYTIAVKQNKKGDNYNLLAIKRSMGGGGTTPPPTQSQPSQPQPQPRPFTVPPTDGVRNAKSITEMKFEGRIVCMKLAVECILQGKFEKKEALESFGEWVSVLDQSIDELK